MYWFAITDEPTDQTDNGKVSNILVGTQEQVTEQPRSSSRRSV